MNKRKILVTAALPYANGHIHLGHLVEYLQTDIWVQFQKLRGHQTLYICADDTHGTAIMLRAKSESRSEEELIAEMQQAHLNDFNGFHIQFDNYGSTNSDENRQLCAEIWSALRKENVIEERSVPRLYDPEANTFLADRFVKGTCPNPACQSSDQYGDNCDKCGSTYSATELIDPVSVLSGATPELRETNQLFVKLERYRDFLNGWTQSGEHLQNEVANYLKGHFLTEGKPLRDWDVSRPEPYFGFNIPDSPGNYWYVWFDAPIGYIASTKQWCDHHNEKLNDWWRSDETEIHHFIGKDIIYFHTLFWPAMLKAAGFNLPTKVHIHGFLTVNNEKMAKSKGTFVLASTYLKHLNPEALRYFYATKLGSRLDDIDMNLDEFISKVNSDLVGKFVNLASRSAKFIQNEHLSATYPDDGGLFETAAAKGERIASFYEECDYNAAMREIMLLADRANKYVEDQEPWKLRKDESRKEELRDICTIILNLYRQIAIYLAPVLPLLAEKTGELLNAPIIDWNQSQEPLLGTKVNPFQHLMKRIEEKQVQAMIEESRESAESSTDSESGSDSGTNPFNDSPETLEKEPLVEQECTFDEFMKIDMRVARIIKAEHVEGADKLLQLTLSLGGDETRNVFAGIKSVYNPEELVGRLVICCANLKPRKMRFGISEGMVLASGPGGKEIFLLNPDDGAKPGMRVH